MVCKHLRPCIIILHIVDRLSRNCPWSRELVVKTQLVLRLPCITARIQPVLVDISLHGCSSCGLPSTLPFLHLARERGGRCPTIHPSIHPSMAASGPAFLHGSLFDSFSSKSRSALGKQPWKALGVASALSLWSLKATGLAERRKAALERGSKDTHWSSIAAYVSPFASLSLDPQEDVVEPKTGVVFPGASPEGKQLTGVGLRKKSILGLKSITVYAYGSFYF